MKVTSNKKITSLLLCMMLIVAMAFTTIGCSDNKQGMDKEQPNTEMSTGANSENSEASVGTPSDTQSVEEENITVVGEGKNQFLFTVMDKDGKEAHFEVHTDKEIVGEALLELELITGDAGPYGLYVKTVNGITADYDVDKTYWAFYVNGEYAMTGVDTTKIEENTTYMFKVEK